MGHFSIAVKVREQLRLYTWLLALSFWGSVSLAGDTLTSSMSFPPTNTEMALFTETERTHWSEHFVPKDRVSLDYSMSRGVTMGGEYLQTNGNRLTLGMGWQRSFDSIQNMDEFLAASSRRSDALQLTGIYEVPLEESWSSYAQSSIVLPTAGSAAISDGYSMIATAGVSYAINPKLKFSIGLLTQKSYLNPAQVMPILGLDWDITDRLKLRTLNGAFLSYDLGKSTAIDLSIQYLDQSFAVENFQGTVFMRMDQPLEMEESSIVGTLGLRHYWKDVFSIRAFAEIAGMREIQTPKPVDSVNVVEMPEGSDENRISFGVEGGIRF